MAKTIETPAGDGAKLPKKAAAKKSINKSGFAAVDNLSISKKDINNALGEVNKDGSKDFELSDGRKVKIIESMGYHCEAAQEIADGGNVSYITALMAQVVTIDGKPIVSEDLKYMKGRDYMLIQGNFSHVNFL